MFVANLEAVCWRWGGKQGDARLWLACLGHDVNLAGGTRGSTLPWRGFVVAPNPAAPLSQRLGVVLECDCA